MDLTSGKRCGLLPPIYYKSRPESPLHPITDLGLEKKGRSESQVRFGSATIIPTTSSNDKKDALLSPLQQKYYDPVPTFKIEPISLALSQTGGGRSTTGMKNLLDPKRHSVPPSQQYNTIPVMRRSILKNGINSNSTAATDEI